MAKLKSQTRIIFVATAFLGAVTAALPQAVYHLKETVDMHMKTHMMCYEACVSATVIGTIIAVIALGALFSKNEKVNLAASGLLFIGGILTIIIPKLNGYCEMESMACREITEPTLIMLGILIILLSAAQISSEIINIHKKANFV